MRRDGRLLLSMKREPRKAKRLTNPPLKTVFRFSGEDVNSIKIEKLISKGHMNSDLQRLRNQAISHSLFPAATLKDAIAFLGFIQADPIRSPATAQDLILRRRVSGYRAGDLELHYPSLDLDEDFLYAYGFLPRDVQRYLHPRKLSRLQALERKVLAVVSDSGPLHPRSLEAHFGKGPESSMTGEDIRRQPNTQAARRTRTRSR